MSKSNAKGKSFEAEVRSILLAIQKLHPAHVRIREQNKITLYDGQEIIPDFELRVDLRFSESVYQIECQNRKRSTPYIAQKIRYAKGLSSYNRFIFIHSSLLPKTTRLALEKDGVLHLSIEYFAAFIARLDEVLRSIWGPNGGGSQPPKKGKKNSVHAAFKPYLTKGLNEYEKQIENLLRLPVSNTKDLLLEPREYKGKHISDTPTDNVEVSASGIETIGDKEIENNGCAISDIATKEILLIESRKHKETGPSDMATDSIRTSANEIKTVKLQEKENDEYAISDIVSKQIKDVREKKGDGIINASITAIEATLSEREDNIKETISDDLTNCTDGNFIERPDTAD